MIGFNELIAELQYHSSPHYYTETEQFPPELAHIFRTASAPELGVNGVYVFNTSTVDTDNLPPQPAVYVVDIDDLDPHEAETRAKRIHKSLWNLSQAPFIILRLPHEVRIYTGFDYSETNEDEPGLLYKAKRLSQLKEVLRDFNADAVDSSRIWKSKFSKKLNLERRVDKRLLKNLRQLGSVLKEDGLSDEAAHTLIGKYVFLRYIRDRNILSDEWLRQHGFKYNLPNTVDELKELIDGLSDFNGQIFPLRYEELEDKHVEWVSAIFQGHELKKEPPKKVFQLAFPFHAFDFRYIPVETLSAIYEQFTAAESAKERRDNGVVYTPEYLADYLLSEVETYKKLQRGMRILDPACGSGIFLVLAYRRLIEREMRASKQKLKPEVLRDILIESIYGVEKNRGACFVAEFSLILTLLHYSEPSQLQNLTFKLPNLHNTHIFHSDFFDLHGEDCEYSIWQTNLKFDFVLGNPPWGYVPTKLNEEKKYIQAWLNDTKKVENRDIGSRSLAEAFSWAVTDLLNANGIVGLLMPATSLFNLGSKNYRKIFFAKHEVFRITNFANFRRVLFGKENSGVLPAATFIYGLLPKNKNRRDIVHYAPFVVTQHTVQPRRKPWSITVNGSDIQYISPVEAERGKTSTWKIALWGTHLDRRVLARINHLFSHDLKGFCQKLGWGEGWPKQGAEFTNDPKKTKARIKGLSKFITKKFNGLKPSHRFLLPKSDTTILEEVREDSHFRRGRETFDLLINPPHLLLSASWQNFAIYSEKKFITPPRQLVISCPDNEHDKVYLKALTVYLSSSLVAYLTFFSVPQWGVYSQRRSVVTSKIRMLPTPDIDFETAAHLASLHKQIVDLEQTRISEFKSKLMTKVQSRLPMAPTSKDRKWQRNLTKEDKQKSVEFTEQLNKDLQARIDEAIFDAFDIPADIRFVVEEFVNIRLLADTPSKMHQLTERPSPDTLLSYARTLQLALNEFAMGEFYHAVSIQHSESLIECKVQIRSEPSLTVAPEAIISSDITIARLLSEVKDELREEFSQWVYIQRNLKLFEDKKLYLYKPSRLIDWTRTQALTDATDMINHILNK